MRGLLPRHRLPGLIQNDVRENNEWVCMELNIRLLRNEYH